MKKTTYHEIAAEILSNMAAEGHAQSGYEHLIDVMVEAECSQADIDIIKEIQSDERNHTLKLFNLAQKYNGVKTSGDDKDEILNVLAEGFES